MPGPKACFATPSSDRCRVWGYTGKAAAVQLQDETTYQIRSYVSVFRYGERSKYMPWPCGSMNGSFRALCAMPGSDPIAQLWQADFYLNKPMKNTFSWKASGWRIMYRKELRLRAILSDCPLRLSGTICFELYMHIP